MTEAVSGFYLINKPAGISTYDIIRIIKKRTGLKKLGHSGTLDPFAQGVVIILAGQMTRLFDFFSSLPKTYRAIAEFGKTTDTLDITGNIVSGNSFLPDLQMICKNLEFFKGQIKQIPPIYSAVHVNGKRAYEYARNGENIQLNEKTVTIYSTEINNYKKNILDFTIKCSSGTYIRSFIRDLAAKCSSSAYLLQLIRCSIGEFSIDNTISDINDISIEKIISVDKGFEILNIPMFTVDNFTAKAIFNGKMLIKYGIDPHKYPQKIISFFTENNKFIAVIDNYNFDMKYIFVSSDENIRNYCNG